MEKNIHPWLGEQELTVPDCIASTMEVPVIDDWVLSTVHMWVIRFDKQEARRLIESKITL